MKACIKLTWSREEAKKFDGVCVTPDNFSAIKDWSLFSVSGEAYYVEKAVRLGATEAKKRGPKPKAPTGE